MFRTRPSKLCGFCIFHTESCEPLIEIWWTRPGKTYYACFLHFNQIEWSVHQIDGNRIERCSWCFGDNLFPCFESNGIMIHGWTISMRWASTWYILESNWIMMLELSQVLTPIKWRLSWWYMKMRPPCCLIIWVLSRMWTVDCVIYWTDCAVHCPFKASPEWSTELTLRLFHGAIDMNIKKLTCCARQNKLKLYEGADGEFMVKCNQANCSKEGKTKDWRTIVATGNHGVADNYKWW